MGTAQPPLLRKWGWFSIGLEVAATPGLSAEKPSLFLSIHCAGARGLIAGFRCRWLLYHALRPHLSACSHLPLCYSIASTALNFGMVM